jgi:hypothetical protein
MRLRCGAGAAYSAMEHLTLFVWQHDSLSVGHAALNKLGRCQAMRHGGSRRKTGGSGDTTSCRMTGVTLHTGLYPQTLHKRHLILPAEAIPLLE